MVANLLDNALEHNVPDGSIDIGTDCVRGVSQLSIGNSGPLVPAAEVKRLFQPFQRLGHDRTGCADGHGLGLAIVRAIANAHDATMSPRPRSAGGFEIEIGFPN